MTVIAEHAALDVRHDVACRAHAVAMARCVTAVMAGTGMDLESAQRLTLRELPADANRNALLQRRRSIGLSLCRHSRVVVDEDGQTIPLDELASRIMHHPSNS
ncbi:MAG TPA: hypothetical protein VIW24_11070 [Aldersonia sp.]